MTFPSTSLPGLYSVAVRASDDALVSLDLSFDRSNGLQLGDVCRLAFHMVNVKCGWVRAEAAVNAAAGHLEIRYPRFDGTGTSVFDRVDSLPVARLLQSAFAPGAPLLRGRLGARWPGSTGAKRRAELCVCSLRKKIISTLRTWPSRGACFIPGRHMPILPSRGFAYPCKPDIFKATYDVEEVSE